jgi:hypothetical protein
MGSVSTAIYKADLTLSSSSWLALDLQLFQARGSIPSQIPQSTKLAPIVKYNTRNHTFLFPMQV